MTGRSWFHRIKAELVTKCNENGDESSKFNEVGLILSLRHLQKRNLQAVFDRPKCFLMDDRPLDHYRGVNYERALRHFLLSHFTRSFILKLMPLTFLFLCLITAFFHCSPDLTDNQVAWIGTDKALLSCTNRTAPSVTHREYGMCTNYRHHSPIVQCEVTEQWKTQPPWH